MGISHFIGTLTLNLSFVIYFVWFVPQIILNYRRKNTEGLSLLMHAILCTGYLTDLIYGFGRDMQWQYRAVTIVGLLSLTIQHFQFSRYGLRVLQQKFLYVGLSVFFLVLVSGSFFIILHNQDIQTNQHLKKYFDILGMVTNACWFCYAFPQIITNFNERSTQGLSSFFVMLSLVLNMCDTTSAWMLQWDYPSKIGPLLSLAQNSILLMQFIYYAKYYHPNKSLASDY